MGRRPKDESPVRVTPRFHPRTPTYSAEHALRGGRWVVVRGIQRWMPAEPKPAPEEPPVVMLPDPEPDPEPAEIACTKCGATTTDWCRTPSGKPTKPHAYRTSPRCCPCGAEPYAPNAKYCERCLISVRRESWRKYSKKRNAA